MAAKKQSFEQALARLEDIVSRMEREDTPLEQSLKLYKEGLELSKLCGDKLHTFEKEVAMLVQADDGIELKRFD